MFPQSEKPSERMGIVIFGVTGDLTRRKLIPALYQLSLEEQLPDELVIIGFARRDWSDEYMRAEMKKGGGRVRPRPARGPGKAGETAGEYALRLLLL